LPIKLSWRRKLPRNIYNLLYLLIFLASSRASATVLGDYQQRIRAAGDDLLENLEVSYVYGGSKIGDAGTCDSCNRCLEEKSPSPKMRFKSCPTCGGCSLDCSHFTQLVFARAGLSFPYITSAQMLDLSADALQKKYNLKPVATTPTSVIPGDMLVYRGHVVIVETMREPGIADIIHATGGKDIRLPGQGIQRERFAKIGTFRGDLLRVIRHAKLDELYRNDGVSASQGSSPARFKFRPVEKRKIQ
jgi:hypothetical protein